MDPRFAVSHPNLILSELSTLCQPKGWKFKSNPKKLYGMNEWEDVYCALATENFRATFSVQQMPGCCAVLIIHHVMPNPYRQETFDETLKIIEQAAHDAGFGSVQMAQVIDQEKYEDEPWFLCLKRKWVASKSFVNAKSGNRVIYLTKNLGQDHWRRELEVPA